VNEIKGYISLSMTTIIGLPVQDLRVKSDPF